MRNGMGWEMFARDETRFSFSFLFAMLRMPCYATLRGYEDEMQSI